MNEQINNPNRRIIMNKFTVLVVAIITATAAFAWGQPARPQYRGTFGPHCAAHHSPYYGGTPSVVPQPSAGPRPMRPPRSCNPQIDVVVTPPPARATVVEGGVLPPITVDNFMTYTVPRVPRAFRVQKRVWVEEGYVATRTSSGQVVQVLQPGHYETVCVTEYR